MHRPRAAVIGAGFGGLALAIRLQSAGLAVTLFEARDKPGGRAYVFEDQGFVFDAGPTVITDPTALEALFALSGRRMRDYVELMPIAPFYRLHWEDGYRFDYGNDQARLEQQIAAKSPGDVAGYRRFLAFAQKNFERGYLGLGHAPFLTPWSMIRVAPQLVALRSHRSVFSAVARYVRDPQLRQAFSFHALLVGGNPFAASSVYSLIHALERRWGVFFPRGGTGALVRALGRLFADLGGTIHLSTPIERIDVRNDRIEGVATALGRRERFDVVASNADVVHTYARLLGGHVRGASEGRRLVRKRFSMSLFVVYFGLRGEHPDLAHHSVMFGPRYRELIAEIFAASRLPEDFSLYLHAPSVSDPSLAPPGCSTYYALAPVPNLRAPVDWSVQGPRLRERIFDYLERRHLPNLRRDLVTTRIFTPQDFHDSLNSHLGSAFSLEPILTQSAYFRVHNRDAQIGGLYFVGAGTHPGAGVPGVIASARATADLILSDLAVARMAPATLDGYARS